MISFKKTVRRLSAAMLAVVIAVGGAFATSAKRFDDVVDYSEQIDILSDIGIIVGTSENEFSPNENVTREQMAMLMFRTMLGKTDAGSNNNTAFKDLSDSTFFGAISWANAAGVIVGTSSTTFEPRAGILMQDAMTMIVRALGHATSSMDAGYPWTYIDAAVKLGLDENLGDIGYEQELTRGQTAAMLYNALTAEYLVPKTTNGNYVIETTIIEYVFGYEIGDCTIVSTNNYSLDGLSTVVKNDYVTLRTENNSLMTVSFDDLGLTGSADSWLGRTVKTIYKIDNKTKTARVFGSTPTDTAVVYTEATVASDNSYITIGGVKYTAVETKSNAVATNDNELYVYCYDTDGKLEKLTTNAAVAAKLGMFELTLISPNNTTGSVAIIKPYSFSKLTITNNKLNIAGNLTADKLTGGMINDVKAVNGDYVLYYFNESNKSLEIIEVLEPTDSMLVTRLTASEATIGGSTFKLGLAAAGIQPSDIAASLSTGKLASVVVKNGNILAVVGANVTTSASQYLVAVTEPVPVYLNGYIRFALTANINGTNTSIITTTPNISKDKAYRYICDTNGVYNLYEEGSAYFTHIDELPLMFKSENDLTVSMNGLPYFTIGGVNFVTDKDTVIIVKNDSGWSVKNGVYDSDIRIAKGASVTAVFSDNAGSVETLMFMFIDNAELGRTDITGSYVKVIAKTGTEYIDGTVYTTYSVLNLNTGAIESARSIYSTLENGSVYALSTSGNILDIAGNTSTGVITGYTASTVTVGDQVYAIVQGSKIVRLNSDNTVTTITLDEIINTEVEFLTSNNDIVIIISK